MFGNGNTLEISLKGSMNVYLEEGMKSIQEMFFYSRIETQFVPAL